MYKMMFSNNLCTERSELNQLPKWLQIMKPHIFVCLYFYVRMRNVFLYRSIHKNILYDNVILYFIFKVFLIKYTKLSKKFGIIYFELKKISNFYVIMIYDIRTWSRKFFFELLQILTSTKMNKSFGFSVGLG